MKQLSPQFTTHVRVKSTTSFPSSNKKGKRGQGSNSSPFLVKKKKKKTDPKKNRRDENKPIPINKQKIQAKE